MKGPMTLSCPHCGLELDMHGPRHEYCPDCLQSRKQPVPLVASSLFKFSVTAPAETAAESADVAKVR